MPHQILRVEQLAGLNGLLLIFIGIEGGNALLGGAILFVLQPAFLQGIQSNVPGQHQRGAVADLEIVGRDGHSLRSHAFHLIPQVFKIQCHAVSQDIHNTRPENTGGEQMQGELAVGVDDGVAGVAAALIADYHVIILGEQVHHAALSLVAPVDSNDCAVSHILTSLAFVLRCSFLSNRSLSPRLGMEVG